MSPNEILEALLRIGIGMRVVDGKVEFREVANDKTKDAQGRRSEAEVQVLREKVMTSEATVVALLLSFPAPRLDGRNLVIPAGVNPMYRWWDKGQSPLETCRELTTDPEILVVHDSGSSRLPAPSTSQRDKS
jgi:hypothetical protein